MTCALALRLLWAHTGWESRSAPRRFIFAWRGPSPCRAFRARGGVLGSPAPVPVGQVPPELAAVYGPAFTGWAEALPHAPTLAGIAGASPEAPATKVAGNVSVASLLRLGRSNALSDAACCGDHA